MDNSKKQSGQPKENFVLPDTLTRNYIKFEEEEKNHVSVYKTL